MAEHVGISRICQGTVTLPCFNTPAEFVGLGCPPGRSEVIIVVAQVAHRLGADAAGPHVTVGSYLRRGYSCQAGNDLAFLNQCSLDNVIVTVAEGLGNA